MEDILVLIVDLEFSPIERTVDILVLIVDLEFSLIERTVDILVLIVDLELVLSKGRSMEDIRTYRRFRI